MFKSQYLQAPTHDSASMKAKVLSARAIQLARNDGKLNAQLTSTRLKKVAPLSKTIQIFFKELLEKREITARGSISILRIARTIADLNNNLDITEMDLSTALDFREEIK